MKKEAYWPTVVRFTEEDRDAWKNLEAQEHREACRRSALTLGSIFSVLFIGMALDAVNLRALTMVILLGGFILALMAENRYKKRITQIRHGQREILAHYGAEDGRLFIEF